MDLRSLARPVVALIQSVGIRALAGSVSQAWHSPLSATAALYSFEKVPLTEAFNRTIFMSAPKPSDEIFPQRGLPWLSIR